MKVYTVAFYERGAVKNDLYLLESQEQLQELIDCYQRKGWDYFEITKQEYEEMVPFMIKHLPPVLHPLIINGSLMRVKVPSPEIRQLVHECKQSMDEEDEKIIKTYSDYLQTIKHKLPSEFKEIFYFPDARVEHIEMPSPDCLVLVVDCRGCEHCRITSCKVVFHGVHRAILPEQKTNNFWIYHQFHFIQPNRFQLDLVFAAPDKGLLGTNSLMVEAERMELRDVVLWSCD